MSRLPFVLSLTALLGASAFLAGQTEPAKETRPFLGVAVQPAKESGEGVVVRETAPDSPAAKAGLKDGDVIVKVNSKDVPDVTSFLQDVGKHKPGDKLNIQVQRNGVDKTIAVTLGSRPGPAVGGPPTPPNLKLPPELKGLLQRPALLGVEAAELTPELRKQLKVKAEHGVVVEEVMPKSPAAKAGLEKNDVIVSVNGKAINDPTELRTAVQKTGAGKEMTLRVERDGKEREVKATPRSLGGQGGGPGGIFPGGFGPGQPPLNIEGLLDQSTKIRDLERRVNELEKRLNELQKKSGSSNK